MNQNYILSNHFFFSFSIIQHNIRNLIKSLLFVNLITKRVCIVVAKSVSKLNNNIKLDTEKKEI